MRKATWGAVGLAVFAIASMRWVSGLPKVGLTLHGILSLGLLAGYILVSLDPPVDARRLRPLLIAGVILSLASFILVAGNPTRPAPLTALADAMAVAVVALPLWLVYRPLQAVWGAAGAVVFMGGFLVETAPDTAMLASIGGFGLAAACCLWVAYILENPRASGASGPTGKRPRVVMAYDVVRLTDEEKAQRIARLDQRLAAGELEEHKYWDLRQEIESR